MVELQIQNGFDREKIVTGLANSDYFVRVVEKKSKSLFTDYIVQIYGVDEKSLPLTETEKMAIKRALELLKENCKINVYCGCYDGKYFEVKIDELHKKNLG